MALDRNKQGTFEIMRTPRRVKGLVL